MEHKSQWKNSTLAAEHAPFIQTYTKSEEVKTDLAN